MEELRLIEDYHLISTRIRDVDGEWDTFTDAIQGAIDEVCAKILAASKGEQILGVFLNVDYVNHSLGLGKSREELFAIGPDGWYKEDIEENRDSDSINTDISTAKGTNAILQVTKRILARLVPISLIHVQISVCFHGHGEFYWFFSNVDQFPQSQGAAYNELLAIFRFLPTREEFLNWKSVRHQWMKCKRIDHQRVLDILQKYPELAHAFLDFGDFYPIDTYIPSMPPLWGMLASPNTPTLDALQQVCKITGEDMCVQNKNDCKWYSTLYFSLLLEPSEEIVCYVYKLNTRLINRQCGSLSLIETSSGGDILPVQLLLANIENGRAELPVLKELQELCPDIMQTDVSDTSDVNKAYEIALCSSSREVVGWILQCLDSSTHQGRLSLDEKFIADPEQFHLLLPILPELQVLEVDTMNWAVDLATELLIELVTLLDKKKLKELILCNIPLRLASCELLQQLIQQDSALESINLSAKNRGENRDQGVLFGPHVCQALATIFRALITSENKNLKGFRFHGIEMFPSWETIFPSGQEITLANHSLKNLSLGSALLHADVFTGLLGCFQSLSTVKLLFSPQSEGEYGLKDCMNQILYPFGHGDDGKLPRTEVSLVYRKLNEVEGDFPFIFRALCQDFTHFKSLCINGLEQSMDIQSALDKLPGEMLLLKVLQRKNYSLENLSSWKLSESKLKTLPLDPGIIHYLLLNKFGRASARNPQGRTLKRRRETFIGLLDKVGQFSRSRPDNNKHKFQVATSLYYGLLRENPGFWSTDARSIGCISLLTGRF